MKRKRLQTAAILTLAILLAALTGWVQVAAGDLHLSLLAAMAFSLLLAVLCPGRAWVWGLLIGLAPVLGELYLTFRGQPVQRGRIELAFGSVLPSMVGAGGGYFMRHMVAHIFEKPDLG